MNRFQLRFESSIYKYMYLILNYCDCLFWMSKKGIWERLKLEKSSPKEENIQ